MTYLQKVSPDEKQVTGKNGFVQKGSEAAVGTSNSPVSEGVGVNSANAGVSETPASGNARADSQSHGDHADDEMHHHHSHSETSRHPGHHHLLSVEHLSVGFRMYDETQPFFSADQRIVQVIDDLSISVHEGEIVAIVGASGSGKTLLADSIMGIYEPNSQVEGDIWFDGKLMSAADLQDTRGHGISLVPQSVSYLNPLVRVGKQVEGFGHPRATKAQRQARRKELFGRYNLDEKVARLYPFELSGGMARRVLLSCALMDNPKLIIADEPTPGLDLPLAIRALEDFRAFADDGGGVLLITHDIELALHVADRIAVFREGTVVEETAVANFASPELLRDPFSQALWHALPEHDFAVIEDAGAYDQPLRQEAVHQAESAPACEVATAKAATLEAYPAEVTDVTDAVSSTSESTMGAKGDECL